MKKLLINPLILFAIVNEVCGTETSPTFNTGGKKQCLEAPVRTYALAKETFAFTDVDDAKLEASWDSAKASKDLVIFWDVESIESNNTDAEIQNGRYEDYRLKEAIKGVDYRHNISVCSQKALESYESSEYTRIFRITDDNEILCEVQTDGTVKGEPIATMIVGVRNDATTDDVPFSTTTYKFKKYDMSILQSAFEMANYEGIYNIGFELGAVSATSILFKANVLCTGAELTTLIDANVILNDAGGSPHTRTFVAYDSLTGYYELTGTGFANGFSLELNGIIVLSTISYEAEALPIAGI